MSFQPQNYRYFMSPYIQKMKSICLTTMKSTSNIILHKRVHMIKCPLYLSPNTKGLFEVDQFIDQFHFKKQQQLHLKYACSALHVTTELSTSIQVDLKHKHRMEPKRMNLPMASTLWARNSIPGKNPHSFVPFLANIEHTQSPTMKY